MPSINDPPRALGIATAVDTVTPVRIVVTDDPVAVSSDTALLVTAGAGLVHAIYHSGVNFVLSMPEPVIRAYAAACEAYRVGAAAKAKEPS